MVYILPYGIWYMVFYDAVMVVPCRRSYVICGTRSSCPRCHVTETPSGSTRRLKPRGQPPRERFRLKPHERSFSSPHFNVNSFESALRWVSQGGHCNVSPIPPRQPKPPCLTQRRRQPWKNSESNVRPQKTCGSRSGGQTKREGSRRNPGPFFLSFFSVSR